MKKQTPGETIARKEYPCMHLWDLRHPSTDREVQAHSLARRIDLAIKKRLVAVRKAAAPIVDGLSAWDGAKGMDDTIHVRVSRAGTHTIRLSDLRRLAAEIASKP